MPFYGLTSHEHKHICNSDNKYFCMFVCLYAIFHQVVCVGGGLLIFSHFTLFLDSQRWIGFALGSLRFCFVLCPCGCCSKLKIRCLFINSGSGLFCFVSFKCVNVILAYCAIGRDDACQSVFCVLGGFNRNKLNLRGKNTTEEKA